MRTNKYLNPNLVFKNAQKRLDIFRSIYGKQIGEMIELAQNEADKRFYFFDRAKYYDDYMQGLRVRLKRVFAKNDGGRARRNTSTNRVDRGGTLNIS